MLTFTRRRTVVVSAFVCCAVFTVAGTLNAMRAGAVAGSAIPVLQPGIDADQTFSGLGTSTATADPVVDRTDDDFTVAAAACTAAANDCSLRGAITMSNADSGDNVITFDPAVFAISKTIIVQLGPNSVPFRIQNAGKLTIDAGTNKVGISMGVLSLLGEFTAVQQFLVLSGGNLTLNNLTIRHGGGLGVNVGGTLTVNNSTISENFAENSGGGGIANFGTLTVNNSTISTNASSAIGDGSDIGGGIFNSGTATIRNSTIAYNLATTSGGIFNHSAGTMTIANTVVCFNSSTFGGRDMDGTFISEGYNAVKDTGFTTFIGDLTGNISVFDFPDIDLYALAYHGGPTRTHQMYSNSGVLDKGKNFGQATDQRGFARPFDDPLITNGPSGDGSDIGATELRPSDPPVPPIVVNMLGDAPDSFLGDARCDSVVIGGSPGEAVALGEQCTLRAAIQHANFNAGPHTIEFDPEVFAAPGSHTIQLTSALPDLASDISIKGPGAQLLSVSGEGSADRYRVFTVPSGVTVSISGLTVTNGNTADGTNGSVGGAGTSGGGIQNSGTLTLTGVAVSGNHAGNGGNATMTAGAGAGGSGGGIYNTGTLSVIDSTVNGNQAGSGGSAPGFPGFGGSGGGIFSSGILTVTNSTVSGNQTGAGLIGGSGGGIHNNSGTLTVSNSTVTANTANNSQGGGISGNSTLRNSIIAGNAGAGVPDIQGTVQSDGYNLVGNTTGAAIIPNPGAGPDITGQDPQLQSLADNGGPTKTHGLLAGSVAIDAGKSFGQTADQRGFTRPVDMSSIPNASGGDGSDIGAFECEAVAPVAISGTVTYSNSIGGPPAPRFVSNVLISGAGSPSVTATTGGPGPAEGQYSLAGFGSGAYTVTPAKTGGLNGSITSFDAARIAQHVAGTSLLTGNQLIVADTSGNSQITSFDAAQIAQFVVNGSGGMQTGTWKFDPVNRVYASVASNITGEDYSALLMGEVSGNWTNSGGRPEGSMQLQSAVAEIDSGGTQLLSAVGPERSTAVAAPRLVTPARKAVVIPISVEGGG